MGVIPAEDLNLRDDLALGDWNLRYLKRSGKYSSKRSPKEALSLIIVIIRWNSFNFSSICISLSLSRLPGLRFWPCQGHLQVIYTQKAGLSNSIVAIWTSFLFHLSKRSSAFEFLKFFFASLMNWKIFCFRRTAKKAQMNLCSALNNWKTWCSR